MTLSLEVGERMNVTDRDTPDYFVITHTIQTEHGEVTVMVSSENEDSATALSLLCETSLERTLMRHIP